MVQKMLYPCMVISTEILTLEFYFLLIYYKIIA